VKNILCDKFGYYLVEFSTHEKDFFRHLSPVAHKFSIIETLNMNNNNDQAIVTDVISFPFLPDSLDCIILPHILEFVDNPNEILHETWISLRPNGYLLLLTFNPLSLFGLYKLFQRSEKIPFTGRYLSYRQLVTMLKSNEFHIDESGNCSFNMPTNKKQTKNQYKLWLALAQLAWPSSANVNIILARKQVSGITPLKVDWQMKLSKKVQKVGSIT